MFVDEIVCTDYRRWRGGDSIFLEAPTGTGKTTFILETLLPFTKQRGKEILYLSNRFLLKEQIKVKIAKNDGLPTAMEWLEDIEEFDGITVLSYQKLQEKCRQGKAGQYHSARYQFVVYDEIHYLLEDAAFNSGIIWLLDFIRYSSNVNIFISATMKSVKELIADVRYNNKVLWRTCYEVNGYLRKCAVNTVIAQTLGVYSELWIYSLEQENKIKDVKYFLDYDEIQERINESGGGEKWLVFMSNKNRAKELKNKINKDVELISADNKESCVLEEILQEQKFSCSVLIATKILDNGVTIKDSALRHIMIDTISKTEFLQMIGRKRFINDSDNVVLYIPKKETRTFSGYFAPEAREIYELLEKEWSTEALMSYMFKGVENYKKVHRFFSWRDNTFVKNPMARIYYDNQKDFTRRMSDLMQIDQWAFIKEQLSWLGIENMFDEKNALITDKREKIIEQMKVYLKNLTGIELNLVKKEQLREKMCDLARTAKVPITSGAKKAGQVLLNRFFADYSIPYRLKSNNPKRKGEKTIWVVEEVEKNVLDSQDTILSRNMASQP